MNADFSRTLALLRQEKGISQRKAAKELGISQALLSHYENGIREPGLAFVKKACDYYHVSADYLLGRTLDRDGGMIDAESLYDSSDEKGTLRGSIAATLQKKMLVNTAGVLFELLGKTNDRTLITSAGSYLGGAFYQLFPAPLPARGGAFGVMNWKKVLSFRRIFTILFTHLILALWQENRKSYRRTCWPSSTKRRTICVWSAK